MKRRPYSCTGMAPLVCCRKPTEQVAAILRCCHELGGRRARGKWHRPLGGAVVETGTPCWLVTSPHALVWLLRSGESAHHRAAGVVNSW